MNIIVTDRKAEQFHFRPDNTLVKHSANFYIPTFLSGLEVSFGYAFRIEKPAKSVNLKYSNRYINKCAEGILLYGIINSKTSQNLYSTSETCFDNSTYIVNQMKDICDCSVSLLCNNKHYFPEAESLNLQTIAGTVLEKLSTQFSFKTGDLIFVEYSKIYPIPIPCEIKLYSNQIPVLEFKVI